MAIIATVLKGRTDAPFDKAVVDQGADETASPLLPAPGDTVMKIRVLGNGGAINDGLAYNAFIINESLLCELPPDVMLSLYRNGVEISSINTIYVSHLHGDHTFGLPFLILSAFFLHLKDEKRLSYTIIGPEGLEKMAESLVISAFTARHPCLEWMKKHCTFVEINASSKPVLLEGYQTSIFELDHLIATYGFSLSHKHGQMGFAYVADTRWCEAIQNVLKSQPRIVLIDLNGKEDDPHPVHLSMKDLQLKALPITGENTHYYGTHLKEAFDSSVPCVRCAKPGMEIVLDRERRVTEAD